MHSIRRVVPAVALAVFASPIPFASPGVQAAPVPVGELGYITSDGALNLVTVSSDGTTTTPQQIGPVTPVTAPDTVKAATMVVTGDGKWLAWDEVISKPDPTYGSLQVDGDIVLRNMTTGNTVTMHTEDYPLGFAGHSLVVIGAHVRRLVMTPSPHFVVIHDGNAYAVATYPHGIVDVLSTSPNNPKIVERDRLRLTSFSGHHTLLHVYSVGRDYRSAAANIDAVSSDGTKLLLERGNHQDFEGLGPSSLFDTYSLGGSTHVRHKLGHYGSDGAHWRLDSATFAGSGNTPWLALHSGYGPKAKGYPVRGVVVDYAKGQWNVASSRAIAVAGNKLGYVVIQGGIWQPMQNSPSGEYETHPTFEALITGPHGFQHTLSNIRATQLLWVA